MASLTRIGSSRVYAGTSGPQEPGFLAFLVWTLPGTPPSVITAQTAWQDTGFQGWFAILPGAPADLALFAQALEASQSLPAPVHSGFAWITYASSTQQIELVELLPIAGSGVQGDVAQDEAFAFRNYGFTLRAGSRVVLLNDSRFIFQYPPLTDYPPPDVHNLALSLEGPARFSFQSQGLIGDFSNSRDTGWDVSVCFYTGTRQIQVWRYPIFENPTDGLHYLFEMSWDLHSPLDATRTFLGFTHLAFRLSSTAGPGPVWSITTVETAGRFPSAFRTIFGTPLTLKPVIAAGASHPARLVFESAPDADGNPARYNLVPSGDFELSLASQQNPKDVLCGLTGTEFIELDRASPPIIRFHPKQSAYAPVFPVLGSAGASGQALLTNLFQTAWASIGRESGPVPVYYSQPIESALFAKQADAPRSEVLALYNAPVAELGLERVFPIAAYGGLPPAGLSRDSLSNFERQILAPVRYQSIVAGAAERPPIRSAAGTTSTTPQGFLAEIDGFFWKQVLLARTPDVDGVPSRLAFHDLPAPLRAAFQASELFLVISSNQNLGVFDSRITIADWPFIVNLGPQSAEPFANVLIVKFCDGSIAERVRNTNAWTNPGDFNTKPAYLAGAISDYIRQAQADVAEVPALQNFVDLVQNPRWNGVLALRVDIELHGFPPDLKGLLGGMDLTRFYGHHFGLTLNFVEGGQQLEMPADSSLFALISYRDQGGDPGFQPSAPAQDAPAAPSSPALLALEDPSSSFDYRVISLLVEFRNSEVTNFESRIILSVSKLFGEAAALASSSSPQFRNSLVFDGNRQIVDSHPSYSFSTREQYRFLLSGTILKYIQIDGAQFVTLSGDDRTAAQGVVERVKSRFNLSGLLNFFPMPSFDAFSFGDDTVETNLPATGLQFNNLGIGMEFDLPAAAPLYLALDPTLMSFDTGLSRARERSVFRKLPLSMSALLTGSADEGVKDLGYVPVRVRELSQLGDIGASWYGLALTLNLGTLGALAGSAGFAATLLVAWSAGGPPNPVQVFLSLPGLGTGKKEISLQSVLKLTLGSVELSTQLDSLDQITAYMLTLRNIALSFLGKKLPSAGVTDLALFSDFRDTGGGSSLSWYAAYYTEPAPPATRNDTARRG